MPAAQTSLIRDFPLRWLVFWLLVPNLAIILMWFVGGPPEPAGTVRVGLAVALGLGAGLAGLAATIVGMDARRSSPQERL